jgi:cell wall-associated NlpC family hydrolase
MGVVVARDAYAQADFAASVELDAVRPGDLYFFARPGRRIHHVGIVVRPGRMVHASETGGVLVEEDLPADRVATLVAAGRLPMP